ncbi:MAG TPA: tripartite tricarboxylate transporter substrate-binding protein [Falsiroseomonas sp.]|jgi:tripartite-type tricarboxylate transporter receptor subunit TctC|nr:tripartite tricarboxylate transporter substrate-binding protein [Falsiroseomonas sp.]
MHATRRALLTTTAAMLAAGGARAQSAWPARDLRLVCPFPPGGTTDVVARLVAAALGPRIGRTVVVENQPGAGSTLAAGRFAREADDHALFLSQIASHGIGPALYRNLAYDPEADFRPVKLLVTVPNVLIANKTKVPHGDVRAFLRDAKANPNTRTFASAGNGTSTHLTGELINLLSGARITHVPYRGAGPGMTALISGDVDSFIDNLPTALPQIRGGTVVALAVTAPQRLPELPNVPALSELGAEFGMQDFQAEAWFGLHAHRSASDAVVGRMSAALDAALADPALRGQLAERGTNPRGGSPEEYRRLVTSELERWRRVVQAANVTVN